jgi:hypothetical protein
MRRRRGNVALKIVQPSSSFCQATVSRLVSLNTYCAYSTGVAEREAGVVPGAVGYAFSRELLAPMEQWLWAHQVAQVSRSSNLLMAL